MHSKHLIDLFKTFYRQCGLCYHSVSNISDLDDQYLHNVSVDKFKKQITTIPKIWGDLSLNFNLIKPFITFDDGYKSLLQTAVPILKKHKIPAFFLLIPRL